MGRLSKTAIARPNLKVHYKKLVDDYSDSCNTNLKKIMPSLPEYLSYCCHQCGHTQKLQAEELNSIVGNAFRMAYAAQLQKQPSFQDVIASQLEQTQTNKALWTKELSVSLKKDKSSIQQQQNNNQGPTEMDIELKSTDASTLRLAPPNSIPGLKPAHKYNVLGPSSEKSHSQQSTPSSDESNSPTEMNSYKRMSEKPPLIKRIAMGLTGGGGGGGGVGGGGGHHHLHLHHNDDDSCPLVVSDSNTSIAGSPTTLNRPLSGGYVNETTNNNDNNDNNTDNNINKNIDNIKNNLTATIEINRTASLNVVDHDFKTKRISQISSSSSSSGLQTNNDTTTTTTTSATITTTSTTTTTVLGPTPPPLPERTDSLNNQDEQLKAAPWFQAGIPREIALEVLAREPVGSFMVRESTSKVGCFALSVRVPRTFHPSGIAHYLIIRTSKGYKIKGFVKEFSTLTSLIVHHSVMPELLPCPLSLSRYTPNFMKADSMRDFADVDLDPDYNTMADFRKMMADINI